MLFIVTIVDDVSENMITIALGLVNVLENMMGR